VRFREHLRKAFEEKPRELAQGRGRETSVIGQPVKKEKNPHSSPAVPDWGPKFCGRLEEITLFR